MSSTSIQVQEAVFAQKELIGSFYKGPKFEGKNQKTCLHCNATFTPEAKFCGECGSTTRDTHSLNNTNLSSVFLNDQRAKLVGMPAFAQVSPQLRKPISPELRREYGKLSLQLARERLFLLLHYSAFLVGNLIGLWSAFTAYNGLLADEVTRCVVAFIPLFFINTVAFAAVVPIGGTKKQIARLKERITYLHYQIEYVNLA